VEFRRPRQRAWPGKWLERVQVWRGPGGGALLWRAQRRRAGTAETRGGGRWEPCSGEPAARLGQQVRREATRNPREGRNNQRWWSKRPVHRFTVTPGGGGNGGSAVQCPLARRTVRRLYRQAPWRLRVFLHTKTKSGAVQSRYGQVTRPRRAWTPASTVAWPQVMRCSGNTRRAWVGKAVQCMQVGGVHVAWTGGPRPVPAGRGTAAGRGAVRGTTRDVARVGTNAWHRRTVPLDLTWFKCVLLQIFQQKWAE
jgi:hypothetical protein